MTVPRINSAHGSDTRNIINRAIDLINTQGKSIQNLVADGQLTPTQYAELVEIVNGNVKKGDVALDDLQQEVLQKFKDVSPEFTLLSIPRDGSVTSKKLSNNSVSPSKASFFNKQVANNLFDGSYYKGTLYGSNIGGSGLKYYPLSNGSSFDARTAVIKVKKNTDYTVRIPVKNSSNMFKIGASKSFISFQDHSGAATIEHSPLTKVLTTTVTERLEPYTFNSGDEEWVYIQVSNAGHEPDIIFVEGNFAPISTSVIGEEFLDLSMIENFEGSNIIDKSISPKKTSFFNVETAKNLFVGEYIGGTLYGSISGGRLVYFPLVNGSNFNARTAVVKIKKNTKYTVKIPSKGTSDRLKIGISKTEVTFKTGSRPEASHAHLDETISEYNSENLDPITFNSGENEWLYVQVSGSGQEPDLIVVEGDEAPTSEVLIGREFLDLPDLTGKNQKYNFPINLNTLYRKSEIVDYIPNPQAYTIQSYNTMFNNLVDLHTDKAKSTYLGDAEFGYKLYKYENTPEPYKKTATEGYDESKPKTIIKLPKIVITAGIHGRERAASYACYYFFKELMENPNDDPVIDFLLRNVHLIFLPVICASGFEDNTYENRNGQNLNRDFGPYGNFTQAETKITKKLIDDNKDMDFHLDFHTTPSLQDPIGYTLTNDDDLALIGNNMYREVGRAWQKENTAMPQNIMHEWGYTTPANIGTAGLYSETEHGIQSTIFEVVWQNKWLSNSRNGEDVTRMGVDILTNMILGCLRSKQ